MQKTFVPTLIFVLVIALVVLFLWIAIRDVRFFHERTGLLSVSFLDVGQGDAVLIESPEGHELLIDGGRGDRKVLRELPRVMGFFDRSIDVVVATHPDSDHIGGLIDVLRRYDVDMILMTNNEGDSPAYDAFMRAVAEEGAEVREVKRGEIYDLGGGEGGSTTLTILFPDRDVRTIESNTASIVARLTYGDADMLFMGDSPDSIERYLVDLEGAGLQSEILKVGHHGSRTSTDPEFLDAVRPRYGIISAGKDNDYGHPHEEVMDTLSRYNVETLNTADVGTITIESDGKELWFK